MRVTPFVLALVLAVVGTESLPAQEARPFDLLITGGRVLDGTGNPWFYADVGIRDGKVVAIGSLSGRAAARTIDARGKVVAPGFIDLHSHAGDGEEGLGSPDARRRAALNVVTQGVTTVVVNPDGGGPLSIAEQRAQLEKQGIGPNTILMVGHNTVRAAVLKNDYRRTARPDEVQAMRALVRKGMVDGAFGLSAGLEYVPGRWSETDEVVALVEEIVPYGGVYLEHERSGSVAPMWWRPSQDPAGPPTLLNSIAETIEIGERTGATVVATHIKARGANYWGSSRAAISLIRRARTRGVAIYADQYPYTTSGSDGGITLVPSWAIGGDGEGENAPGARSAAADYAAALRRTLADPEAARKVRQDIAHELEFRGGAENIVIFEHPDASLIGKSVADMAAARGISTVEAGIALQLEGFKGRPGGARLRSFSFSEEDIDAFAAQPWVATASDGGVALPEDGPAVHARYYGTFPRKIRRYALERGVISVEAAVRSMTSLPAQILGLRNRGLLREGFVADVVVMDLERVRDRATFTDPHQYAEGIEYVVVGGKFVVDNGSPTGALAGRVITPREGRAAPATQ
ncbi:MAG: amidohydrolase family protein [Gemmatimonadetes bacterium]|nr:amidohydrolase family protein [Gemmatimonadota bacterium]